MPLAAALWLSMGWLTLNEGDCDGGTEILVRISRAEMGDVDERPRGVVELLYLDDGHSLEVKDYLRETVLQTSHAQGVVPAYGLLNEVDSYVQVKVVCLYVLAVGVAARIEAANQRCH